MWFRFLRMSEPSFISPWGVSAAPWAGWVGRGMLSSPAQCSAVHGSSSGAHRQALFRKNQRIQPEMFGLLHQSLTYFRPMIWGQNWFLCCARRKKEKKNAFYIISHKPKCPGGKVRPVSISVLSTNWTWPSIRTNWSRGNQHWILTWIWR